MAFVHPFHAFTNVFITLSILMLIKLKWVEYTLDKFGIIKIYLKYISWV